MGAWHWQKSTVYSIHTLGNIASLSNNGCGYTSMTEWEIQLLLCYLAQEYIFALFWRRHKALNSGVTGID